MDDFSSEPDEHDYSIILIFVFLAIVFGGIWFYNKKADDDLKKMIEVNNPVIKNIQNIKKVDESLENYGIVNPENNSNNELEY